jgi:hypothetical protein
VFQAWGWLETGVYNKLYLNPHRITQPKTPFKIKALALELQGWGW